MLNKQSMHHGTVCRDQDFVSQNLSRQFSSYDAIFLAPRNTKSWDNPYIYIYIYIYILTDENIDSSLQNVNLEKALSIGAIELIEVFTIILIILWLVIN